MEKKDYYKVLGVASDAEEIIIRAAYKALVQKYHPDKFDGTEEEADKRIRELNEAYETLSSPVKRKAYDEQLNSESSTNKKNHTKSKEDNEWGLAVSYYSDLPAISSRLSVFSDELARNFRSYILSTKKYDKRHAIASKYEKDFLKNNFGKNPVVVDFATSLFLSGKKEAANELSQTLSVLGDAKFEKIIMNISEKHNISKKFRKQNYEPVIKRKQEEQLDSFVIIVTTLIMVFILSLVILG